MDYCRSIGSVYGDVFVQVLQSVLLGTCAQQGLLKTLNVLAVVALLPLLVWYGLSKWTQIKAIARFAHNICIFSSGFLLKPIFKIRSKILI